MRSSNWRVPEVWRVNIFFLAYLVLILLFVGFGQVHSDGDTENVHRWKLPDPCFTVYHRGRFWRVDTEGRIYQLLPADAFEVSPVVTGLTVDEERGRVVGDFTHFPRVIPDTVFEINVAQKYVTLHNGAIVKFVELEDLETCLKTAQMSYDYLLPNVVYLYSKGRIYKIG